MTTIEFQPGDIVRCIDPWGFRHIITQDELYCVAEAYHERNMRLITIWVPGHAEPLAYSASRFIFVQHATSETGRFLTI